MSEARIDVQVEHKHAAPPAEKKHPNTCPKCGSHYRDDELEAARWVCGHCGHHYPMRARSRIDWYADDGSFVEEAADVKSEDPLDFFDLRPYAERLAEAELNTGLGEAAVIGQATIDGHPVAANPELTLSLTADNLFDVNARASTSELKDFAPLAGRDIRLTARVGF